MQARELVVEVMAQHTQWSGSTVRNGQVDKGSQLRVQDEFVPAVPRQMENHIPDLVTKYMGPLTLIWSWMT